MARALVLTALPVEYNAVRGFLKDVHQASHPTGATIYERGIFEHPQGSWEVWIAEIGPGNPSAATEAERAIAHVSPDYTFFCGVAGGVKDVNLGDVIVGTKIYGYESGKETGKEFMARPGLFVAAPQVVARARVEARAGLDSEAPGARRAGPMVYVAPIAAGQAVVSSARARIARLIRKNYSDALAVEMEGHGMMTSAYGNQQPAAVIRGISDLLGKKAEADKLGWQATAANNAAKFLFKVLPHLEVRQGPVATTFSFEEIRGYVISAHYRLEKDFAPQIIVTMSGPGSIVACYLSSLTSGDTPVFVAITFPLLKGSTEPVTDAFEMFSRFAEKDGWQKISTEKWNIFLPPLLFEFPAGTRVLIFDDKVITGSAQRALEAVLVARGYEVRRAAVFSSSAQAASMHWVGKSIDTEFHMPWGYKHGRY